MVVTHERAVWRKHPGTGADGEDGHWDPFHKHGKNREALCLTRTGNVQDAKGDVAGNQQENQHANPDIPERDISNEVSHSLQVVAPDVCQRLRENVRPVDSRDDHDTAGNKEAFCRTIEEAKIQRVRVVRLPRREEHGEARDKRSEDAGRRCAQPHGGRFEQAGECAVERVDAVVEELSQAARGSGSSGLLSVDIVHRLVHEESECKAKV